MTRELEDSRETVTCAVCVQLFQDARVLNCSHSFCMHCLIGCQAQAGQNGVTEINCPICREVSVPTVDDIPLLPSNVFANKVAELIRSNDCPSYDQRTNGGNNDEEEPSAQFFVGNSLPEPVEVTPQPIRWSGNMVVIMSVSAVVAGCSIIFGESSLGVFLGLLIMAIGLTVTIQVKRQQHSQLKHAYTCNGCHNKQYAIARYRCGMCNDFTLCSVCFAEDNLSQRKHIFLKLKFPQKRELPLGPVLKPQAFGLAETFDYGSSIHGRAYVHSPDRLLRIPAIKCSFCGAMPIEGFRYKCGMCSNYDLCANCEIYSEKVHNKSHVFMVLKHKAEINLISEPLLRAQFY